MQEKTSEPFVPAKIGYLGAWISIQKQRRNGVKGFPALSKAEEDEVDSMHHALSM